MDVAHCHLDGNADAVEFCPHEPHRHVLAASTYTLHEGNPSVRSGSVSIFIVDRDSRRLDLSHRFETAGVFDIKWAPSGLCGSGPSLLAQADVDGFLRIHRLETETSGGKEFSLTETAAGKISSSMCLYLDWDPSPSAKTIATGLSDGSIAIASLRESHLQVATQWRAHEFELWVTCFDSHRPNLVYTGSDDCTFAGWDLRSPLGGPAFRNSRSHQMGVCCVSSGPHDSNAVVTGSYDEKIRVWDLRAVSMPVVEGSAGLGGGVWRVKHNPWVPGLVLAACMHNGFAIVEIGGSEVKVVEGYKRHGSLAYGADWHRAESVNDDQRRSLVATCSFYDKLLRLWVPNTKF